MSADERALPGSDTPPLPPDMEDLADLVDDAAKALSIGGTRQADSDVRRVVGLLKRQLSEEETAAE